MRLIPIFILSFLISSSIDLTTAMEKAGYEPIELKKNLFGEFVLNANINKKNFELMLSLNIEQTFIDKILADKYEFETEEVGNRELQLNGDTGKMFAVKIQNFTLGKIESNNNEIGAIDFSDFSYLKQLRVEGILGKSFLIKNEAVLDIAKEKLYIKKQ
jgi:hypothetical protein